tara:strand:- start:2721 stop:4229 length:1509 start_codon:yes stop_codon:yes gene_type:complete
MTNLIEVAEELEFVPKESLIEMAQNPNSRFPSYMVLSEIQRRTQMEKMYNAARMERPQTTVAQELVGEFSQPQGLAGAMTDDLGRLPNNFSDSVAPANSLMQMANGGQTGSDAIREAERLIQQESILDRLAQDRSERQTFGEFASGIGDFFSPEGQPTVDEVRRSNLEAFDRLFGGSETEDNYLEKAGKFVGVLDEEGNIDKVGTALALASINPLFRAGRYAYGAAKGLPGLLQRIFPRFYQTKKGDYISTTSPQGRFLKGMSGTRPDKFKKTFRGDMKRVTTLPEKAVTAVGLGGLGGAVLRQMSEEGQKLDTEELDKKQLDNRGGGTGGGGTGGVGTGEGGKDKGDDGKKKDGLLGKIDPLDIAKLGGIILGAKGTGDIGQGITALASDVQQRRAAEQARQDVIASREKGDELKQAQIDQIRLAIESAPLSQLTSLYKYTTEALRLAQQSMIPDDKYIGDLQDELTRLIEKANELTGRAANTNTGQESIEGLGATVTQGG